MDKSQAMKVMAESHRETVEELGQEINRLRDVIKGNKVIVDIASDELKVLERQNKRFRKSLETIFNESLEFSGYEDLDVHNPELFQFAFAVNNESQQALESESDG